MVSSHGSGLSQYPVVLCKAPSSGTGTTQTIHTMVSYQICQLFNKLSKHQYSFLINTLFCCVLVSWCFIKSVYSPRFLNLLLGVSLKGLSLVLCPCSGSATLGSLCPCHSSTSQDMKNLHAAALFRFLVPVLKLKHRLAFILWMKAVTFPQN